MSRRALVVEGGGMRGIFSAGVLDAFSESEFDPFDIYLGVSAGACNISSQLAGQVGRNVRIYTNQMLRPQFISLRKFLSGGHYMDLDWLWQTYQREDPLDVLAAESALGPREFLIVSTSMQSGEAVYLRPSAENWLDCLKATSAVPVFYRGGTKINGVGYVDGGVADPLPVQEGIRRGAREIVVVRSRPANFAKTSGIEALFSSLMLRGWKHLSKAILRQAKVYMDSLALINNPPEGIKIHQIAPTGPLHSTRTSRNLSDLRKDYDVGRIIGISAIKSLRDQFQKPSY